MICREYFKRTADEFKDGERAGTLSYMPPEVFTGGPYGRLIDLWAFGITLHKMVIGQTPFRSANDEKLKVNPHQNKLSFLHWALS